jgi:hypothetical protein
MPAVTGYNFNERRWNSSFETRPVSVRNPFNAPFVTLGATNEEESANPGKNSHFARDPDPRDRQGFREPKP